MNCISEITNTPASEDEIKKIARKELDKCEQNNVKEWSTIKNSIKDALHEFLYVKTKRNPMLIPIITEI